jgi:hypothetical protein
VDNVCDHVDLGAVAKVLPYVAEALDEVDNPVPNVMTCSGTIGVSNNPDGQGVFGLYVELFDDNDHAAEHYDTFYRVNVDMSGATDVTGIGQRAHKFVVPTQAGTPTVRVLDGNAVITCEWHPLFTDKRPWPDGLFEALTETIRSTMASLHNA